VIRLAVLPGDGIGPEITDATLRVLEAADRRYGLGLAPEHHEIGLRSLAREGSTLPDRVVESARASDGILLGPISHLDYPSRDKGGINVSAAVRVGLDLYANVRPARTRPGLGRGHAPLDLVIMREATEGIARRAFELARRRRKRVHAVHKANTFLLTDGLWLREVRKVAAEFPDVELHEVIVDACTAYLVRDPQRFDVIVATNFHADILSDLASELSGGLGLAGSTNAGDALCCAQAQHGSAPDIEGQDKANPTSLILSAAMLLDWLAERRGNEAAGRAAAAIHAAVDAALADPATRTPDLGGPLGTRAFGNLVAGRVEAG
jgi:3-isopropylmalate dehydrogenase